MKSLKSCQETKATARAPRMSGNDKRAASPQDAQLPGGERRHPFCDPPRPRQTLARKVGPPEDSGSGVAGVLEEVREYLLSQDFLDEAERYPNGWQHFIADHLGDIIEGCLNDVLRNMEGFFQILTNLPDGLFTVDTANRINYFNPAAERLTGLSSSSVIGKHCNEVFDGIDCSFDFSGEFDSNCADSAEFEIVNRNGPVRQVISDFSMILDHYGSVTGGVHVFKDITVRKRLEDDLRKSETKYRRIFEGSKDMIFLVSSDQTVRDVNPAGVELLGYGSKEEILTVGSVENLFVAPLHAKVFQKQVNRWGFIKDFDTFFRTKDGAQVHCLLSGSAVKDQYGRVVAYEGIAKDITARMDVVRSLRQRYRELSLLNSVALVMNATQDLDVILDSALKNVLEVLGVEAGAVVTIDHGASSLNLKAVRGFLDWVENGEWELSLRDTELMESLFRQDLCLAPEHAFPPFGATIAAGGGRGQRTLICFLINGKEKARGFLALDIPASKVLTRQDLDLLGSLGNFLGGAIENARLQQTIRRHGEELKRLTAELFNTQETERKRLARELHDEAGQALTGINLGLESADKRLSPDLREVKDLIAEVKRQVNHTYGEMRRISHRLHPALLADLGLEPALDAYFKRIARHSGLRIDFRVVGFEERPIPEVETTLYRLSQEALTNTLKHSGAQCFKLSIVKGYPDVIFTAEDDGTGFDIRNLRQGVQSLGIVSMRERAASVGGSFSLRTAIGKGTNVRITIPVQERPL